MANAYQSKHLSSNRHLCLGQKISTLTARLFRTKMTLCCWAMQEKPQLWIDVALRSMTRFAYSIAKLQIKAADYKLFRKKLSQDTRRHISSRSNREAKHLPQLYADNGGAIGIAGLHETPARVIEHGKAFDIKPTISFEKTSRKALEGMHKKIVEWYRIFLYLIGSEDSCQKCSSDKMDYYQSLPRKISKIATTSPQNVFLVSQKCPRKHPRKNIRKWYLP